MRLAVVFFYAVTISCINSNAVETYVKHVCGGEYKCDGGTTSSIPKDSCCRPCECNEICLEKGSCCEDTNFTLTNNTVAQKCLPSTKLSRTHLNHETPVSYFARAICPVTFKDQHIRNKCEIDEPESLEDIAFVSSKDGTVVYKNKHCAVCHDEEDFVMWNLVIDRACIREAFLGRDKKRPSTNASYIIDKLLTTCSLSFERPAITDIRYTICFEGRNLISTCNSKRPNNVTENFKDLCLSDRGALTFFHDSLRNKAYANVFCYLCEKLSMVKCDLDNLLKLSEPFPFLLDHGQLEEAEKSVTKSHMCRHNEVFDSFFDVCRPTTCPLFQIPVRGKCKSLVAKSSRLNFVFYFQINITSQKKLQSQHFDGLSTALYNSFPRLLGLPGCSSCGVSVYLGQSYTTAISVIYCKFVLTTSSNCSHDRVLNLLAKLEERENEMMTITHHFRNVNTVIKHIKYEQYNQATERAKMIYSKNIVHCRHNVPSRLDNCQKVTLTHDEYSLLANKSKHAANFEVRRFEENYVEICKGDFKQLTEAVTSNSIAWSHVCGSLIPCVLFSILSVQLVWKHATMMLL